LSFSPPKQLQVGDEAGETGGSGPTDNDIEAFKRDFVTGKRFFWAKLFANNQIAVSVRLTRRVSHQCLLKTQESRHDCAMCGKRKVGSYCIICGGSLCITRGLVDSNGTVMLACTEAWHEPDADLIAEHAQRLALTKQMQIGRRRAQGGTTTTTDGARSLSRTGEGSASPVEESHETTASSESAISTAENAAAILAQIAPRTAARPTQENHGAARSIWEVRAASATSGVPGSSHTAMPSTDEEAEIAMPARPANNRTRPAHSGIGTRKSKRRK